MIVVSVPTDKIVDEDGEMPAAWGNFFDQNTQQMQQSLSNEGFWIPGLTTTQLATIAASYTIPGTSPVQFNPSGVQLGTLVYDTVTNQLKVFLSDSPTTASFHVITTS